MGELAQDEGIYLDLSKMYQGVVPFGLSDLFPLLVSVFFNRHSLGTSVDTPGGLFSEWTKYIE